jgi:hypothetical protein
MDAEDEKNIWVHIFIIFHVYYSMQLLCHRFLCSGVLNFVFIMNVFFFVQITYIFSWIIVRYLCYYYYY